MIRAITLSTFVLTTLTGCPLAMMGQSPVVTPEPAVTSIFETTYPKVVKQPDIVDYIDPTLHIDRVGLLEYRRALSQYRAYLERYEQRLTAEYNLPERTDEERQVTIVTREVVREVPIPTAVVADTCPPPTPSELKFRPLIPPPVPIFKRNEDTDVSIIDTLVNYILEVHVAIKEHNEEHTQ